MGGFYLIIVDAHSKRPEFHHMTTTTPARTIQVLRRLFLRYGIQEQLLFDHGSQFIYEEFSQFL